MFISLVLTLFLLSVAAIDQDYLNAWRVLPSHVDPPLYTEDQLVALEPAMVSPVLRGGLGNMMFEMAAACSLAHKIKRDCVIAWWNQVELRAQISNEKTPPANRTSLTYYLPFGGRDGPAAGITLKHIFPNIVYADFEPRYRKVRNCGVRCFEQGWADLTPFPKHVPSPYFVNGYFFYQECT